METNPRLVETALTAVSIVDKTTRRVTVELKIPDVLAWLGLPEDMVWMDDKFLTPRKTSEKYGCQSCTFHFQKEETNAPAA